MTLKQKTLSVFFLAMVVMVLSLLVFQGYRSANTRQENIRTLLDEISHNASEIEKNIIGATFDREAFGKSMAALPLKTSRLQAELRTTAKPEKLIDLEITFVRIRRLMSQAISGEVLEQPLLLQIRHETWLVSRSIDDLFHVANEELNSLRYKAEWAIVILFLTLFASTLGMIVFVFMEIVRPILVLSRQVDEVRQGTRKAIDPLSRGDEIGKLSEFSRQAIDNISEKNAMLQLEINDHNETEQKLRQSAATLENVLNNSNPICITSLDCDIIQANRAYYEIWPKRPQEGTILKCYLSRPGPFCHTERCPLPQIVAGQDVVTFDSTKKSSAGTTLNFLITARPFKDENGVLVGIVENFQDITVRKEAEAALVKERDKLEVALSEVKTLQGFIPICASCKSIRDDKGYWGKIEEYIRKHSEVQFSHGLCPKCAETLYPELFLEEGASLVSEHEIRPKSGTSLYVCHTGGNEPG